MYDKLWLCINVEGTERIWILFWNVEKFDYNDCLSITGSRVPGLCGQKTPWRDGEIITLPRHVYQVSFEILILISWNFLPNTCNLITCTECDMDQMDCIDISIEYLKQVLDMKVMGMAYNQSKLFMKAKNIILSLKSEPPSIKSENFLKKFL